jgi:hypothetical protein
MPNGPHLVAQQSHAKLRQQHRRELRLRLSELIELANDAYQRADWSAFEEFKHAIRLTLSDLASGKHDGRRLFSTLPPSSRRGGAEE